MLSVKRAWTALRYRRATACLLFSYIFNLFDLGMTLLWTRRFGADTEASPLGRWILEHGALYTVKGYAVGVLLVTMWVIIRKRPSLTWTAYLPAGAYTLLAVYHVILFIVVQVILHR